MSARLLSLAVLVLAPLAFAAPAPFLPPRHAPAHASGLGALQGEWVAVDGTIPALAAQAYPKQGLLQVSGSTFSFRGRAGGPLVSYKAIVGPGGAIDFPSPPVGTHLGVYRIKDGVLTIRYDAITRPRPKSVEGKAPGYLEHYKRMAR